MSKGMEKVEIYRFQLEEIIDALRMTANIHGSRNPSKEGQTCHDRTVVKAEKFAKNALEGNIDREVSHFPLKNKPMKKLLVITPGSRRRSDSVFYLLDPETGEALASHFCSHALFAKSDLYEGRPKRIEAYTERFGEIEVKFIDETNIKEEELIAKNKEFYKEKTDETI